MNIDEIIKQVAKVHNTTPEEVYAEMQIALDAAFQSSDPEVQKEWAKIPFREIIQPRRMSLLIW